MPANWCEMTSATGGTGALTLTAVSGAPSLVHVFGGSGTRRLPYSVVEFSDSTRSGEPIKAESGWGEINLATLVLTRSRPETTWNGTAYDGTTPAAISFGTTANNIRVTLTPLAAFSPTVLPAFTVASPMDNLGAWPANHTSVSTPLALVANREYYIPFHWALHGEYTQFGIGVTTLVSGSGAKLALYDLTSTGLPGAMRHNLTGATPLVTTTTGIKVGSAAGVLQPGYYYMGLMSGHAIAVKRAEAFSLPSPLGITLAGINMSMAYRTGSYATGLPDPAPLGTALTASASTSPLVHLRAAA